MRFLLLTMFCSLLITNCTCKGPSEPSTDQAPQASTMPKDENHVDLSQFQSYDDVVSKKQPSDMELNWLKAIAQREFHFQNLKKDLPEARPIYLAHCMRCHGEEGRGDGPQADTLAVAPTNFREWEFKYSTELPSIVYGITYGRGEGEMPNYGSTLKEEEIWSLAFLIKEWSNKDVNGGN